MVVVRMKVMIILILILMEVIIMKYRWEFYACARYLGGVEELLVPRLKILLLEFFVLLYYYAPPNTISNAIRSGLEDGIRLKNISRKVKDSINVHNRSKK
ncbi:hypothetical protein BSPWISOXPB_3144 [uncultured Gammaproteobacteria bacterium]|nr:hypothetical protein BSPWISOXPB_3144 [uncultured Gammaproteobacteria bacterium]